MPVTVNSKNHNTGFNTTGKMDSSDFNISNLEFTFLNNDDFLNGRYYFGLGPDSDSDMELPDSEVNINLLEYIDNEFNTNELLTRDTTPTLNTLNQLDKDDESSVFWEDSDPEPTTNEMPFIAWHPVGSTVRNTEDDLDSDNSYHPDSPSSHSGTATGDDSDVDIETITDLPRSADYCGYSASVDSSPSSSPAPSPAPRTSKSSTNCKSQSPLQHGMSSSKSLAENLMAGRPCIQGRKRKTIEDRPGAHKRSASTYTSFVPSTSSVNFHDYAMSPQAYSLPSPASSDTGRPTVATKRIYRKKQQQLSDVTEKQSHHNQLERNRRQKLAGLFGSLRDVIPMIAYKTKTSKVVVLKEAVEYIKSMEVLTSKQVKDISDLSSEQSRLKEYLKKLDRLRK